MTRPRLAAFEVAPDILDTTNDRPSSRCLSIDTFIFFCIFITGFLRVWQNLDPA